MSRNEQKGSAAATVAKLAQATKGIADIVKGAVAGGLHGAAIAAAKAFAPQLIKIAVCIIIFFLILPVIVFFSLPNIFFQWPSVDEAEVAAMNEQAAYIENLYKSVESYTAQEADRIVVDISPGYDDVVVHKDLGGVSRNWLIAINSVMQEQKLGQMNESQIQSLVTSNMDYSHTTETYEEDTGRTDENGDPITETKTRIIINIWTITPDALMDKLGFGSFQKEWAAFIYGNINDSQLVDPSDPDYPSGELINYGDLVFTDGGREVVYYNQTDERWGNEMYGTKHTIAIGGCGPTALAMVVSSMTDTMIDPKAMADWAVDNGYCADGNGSYHALIPDGAEHFGLNVEGAGPADGQKIIDALAEGKLVVAIMGPGHFTVSGHFIVLRGITAEGNALVADPVSVRKSGMEWDMRIVLGESKGMALAGGSFWIISQQDRSGAQ